MLAARLRALADLADAGELRGQAKTLARRLASSPRVLAALRDARIRQAGATLPGDTRARAEALARAARLVIGRRAAVWQRSGPPASADPVEAALFHAGAFAELPTSDKHMARILDENGESLSAPAR